MKYKPFTRIFTAILTLVMVFLFIPTNIYAAVGEMLEASANDRPVTKETLKYIYNADQLAKIGNDPTYPLDGSYILMNDIDLSGIANWDPIGDADDPFCGKFLGAGFTISGMNIAELPMASSNGCAYAGLFGYNTGLIRDMQISGSVTANTEGKKAIIGSLVGHNAGVIDNCKDSVSYDDFVVNADSFFENKLYEIKSFHYYL